MTFTAWSPRRSKYRATRPISMATGIEIPPAASSAVRLTCRSSISSSRARSRSAGPGHAPGRPRRPCSHISVPRAPIWETRLRARGGQPPGETLPGMRGDVLGEVTASLQLGEDTQDYQQAAIASRVVNVRTNQFVEDVLLDVAMEGIDELFTHHQSPGAHRGQGSGRAGWRRREPPGPGQTSATRPRPIGPGR